MRLISLCLLLCLLAPGEKPVTAYVKDTQVGFAASARALQQAVAALNVNDPRTIIQAKAALKDCRIHYKKLSFFLEYFFTSEAYVFNSPPKYEIDEPYIEWEAPVGLQQIEALLYDSAINKPQLIQDVEVIVNTADDIRSLLYNFSPTDQQIRESIDQELNRIMTLYITGYDAPLLKSGIEEATASLTAISNIIKDSTNIQSAIHYLQQHKDFDSFNRLEFLTQYALPLQKQLGYRSLFNPLTITGDTSRGKQLFFDKSLSASNTRSCATCHQPDKYFTDGLTKNGSLLGGPLPRHTPGLTYAGFQHAQFWDGRAKTLEEQIITVLKSKEEMGAADSSITNEKVDALAAYVRTLSPFNAPLDKYLAGDHNALTKQQQHGFNLFMGKAQCGTCHFAPVFNGSTPPLYERTEFEVLDKDSLDTGRYGFFKIDFYRNAFKTPTVRNAAATAPYMHDGRYRTLEEVIDFYDKAGLNTENQTMSTQPLRLTPEEKKSLVAFMQALTDEAP
jgi:cytochrome c peroxidase